MINSEFAGTNKEGLCSYEVVLVAYHELARRSPRINGKKGGRVGRVTKSDGERRRHSLVVPFVGKAGRGAA